MNPMATEQATPESRADPQLFDIPADTISQAVKCWCEHGCLRGENPCMCPAERQISAHYLFVKPKQFVNCPYCMVFGTSSCVCTCPVRNAIFAIYQQ